MSKMDDLLKRAKVEHNYIIFRQIGDSVPTNSVNGMLHEFRSFEASEKDALKRVLMNVRLHKGLGKPSQFFYRPLVHTVTTHDGKTIKQTTINWTGK